MNITTWFSNARRAKRVVVKAVACGTLSALPACHIPDLRPAVLNPVVPAGFNGSPNGVNGATITGANEANNSAHLRVDEFYNDSVLTRMICEAVAANRELKILEEEVEIARAEIVSRRGAFLPLVGVRASAGWDENSVFTPLGAAEEQLEYRPGRHFPKTPGDFLLGLNFLVPVDIWRELRNARDAAVQRYLAAVERRNDFQTRLVAEVAENYYGLMALDQQLANLDKTIELQQQSLEIAQSRFKAGRDTDLPVKRFEGEVRKNQSEKLVVRQEIVEAENRINFLLGRLPQPVDRNSTGFFDQTIHPLNLGVPAQLLLNRPDIRQAERELEAAGLDVKVARAQFFPRLDISGTIGYRAFNPRYLFDPDALVFNAAGDLVAPLVNRAAIRADYQAANAQQLQRVYDYQRVVLDAFTEVVNRVSMVENYTKSTELRKQQLQALEDSVEIATRLFNAARVEYIEVLFAQRDLLDARTALIDAKRQQLSAIVNTYQALGGGTSLLCPPPGEIAATAPPPPGTEFTPAPRPLPVPRPEKDAAERPARPDALPPSTGPEQNLPDPGLGIPPVEPNTP